MQQLPISFFTSTPSADVLSRAASDLAAVEAALATSVTWGLMPALDAIAGTVVLFVLDWRLALIASLVWPWCARFRPHGACGHRPELRAPAP